MHFTVLECHLLVSERIAIMVLWKNPSPLVPRETFELPQQVAHIWQVLWVFIRCCRFFTELSNVVEGYVRGQGHQAHANCSRGGAVVIN